MAAVKSRRKTRFPGESADYCRARNRLLKSEVELRRQIESVAAQRRKLPLGGEVSKHYVFEASAPGEKGVKKVRLSQLFQPGNTIKVEGGPTYETDGDITNHEYEVRNNGQPVAQISRQWFSIRDAYGVAIAPEVDQALMLAAAVCIDEISERERERNR